MEGLLCVAAGDGFVRAVELRPRFLQQQRPELPRRPRRRVAVLGRRRKRRLLDRRRGRQVSAGAGGRVLGFDAGDPIVDNNGGP